MYFFLKLPIFHFFSYFNQIFVVSLTIIFFINPSYFQKNITYSKKQFLFQMFGYIIIFLYIIDSIVVSTIFLNYLQILNIMWKSAFFNKITHFTIISDFSLFFLFHWNIRRLIKPFLFFHKFFKFLGKRVFHKNSLITITCGFLLFFIFHQNFHCFIKYFLFLQINFMKKNNFFY